MSLPKIVDIEDLVEKVYLTRKQGQSPSYLITSPYMPAIEVIESRIERACHIIHLPFGGIVERVPCECNKGKNECTGSWIYSEPEYIHSAYLPRIIKPHEKEKPDQFDSKNPCREISMGATSSSTLEAWQRIGRNRTALRCATGIYSPRAYRAKHYHEDRILYEEWFDRSKIYHRDIGPAHSFFEDGYLVAENYFRHGDRHNEYGPAYRAYKNGALDSEQWFYDDAQHRLDGPAMVTYFGDMPSGTGWYWRGTSIPSLEAAIKQGTPGIIRYLEKEKDVSRQAVAEIALACGAITEEFHDILIATSSLKRENSG